MKVYHSSGFEEFSIAQLRAMISKYHLTIEVGRIKYLKILERKFLTNKGNALDGAVMCADQSGFFGLNIGGNPIGTGYKHYIPFLEEMHCKKIGSLFILSSLIGRPIPYLTDGKNLKGYLT